MCCVTTIRYPIRLSPSKKSADGNAHSSIFFPRIAGYWILSPTFPSEMASIKSPSISTSVSPSRSPFLSRQQLAAPLLSSSAVAASKLSQPWPGVWRLVGAGGSTTVPRRRPNIGLGDYGAAKDDLPIDSTPLMSDLIIIRSSSASCSWLHRGSCSWCKALSAATLFSIWWSTTKVNQIKVIYIRSLFIYNSTTSVLSMPTLSLVALKCANELLTYY